MPRMQDWRDPAKPGKWHLLLSVASISTEQIQLTQQFAC